MKQMTAREKAAAELKKEEADLKSGRAQQARENPGLKEGSVEQLRDLTKRQQMAGQAEAEKGARKAETDYAAQAAAAEKARGGRTGARKQFRRDAGVSAGYVQEQNKQALEQRTKDEEAAKRIGFVAPQQQQQRSEVAGLMGRGCPCGGAMPSAGFLRQVLMNYRR
jgi:hypothetical protein